MAHVLAQPPSCNNKIETERGCIALSKAKAAEDEKFANGWKYVKVNGRTQVLVPCDNDGNPTKVGEKMINRVKYL